MDWHADGARGPEGQRSVLDFFGNHNSEFLKAKPRTVLGLGLSERSGVLEFTTRLCTNTCNIIILVWYVHFFRIRGGKSRVRFRGGKSRVLGQVYPMYTG